MNFGYTYTFTPFSQIVKETTLISEFSFIGFITLIILVGLLFINVYYITPKVILINSKVQEKYKSKKKREIVNRILTQKEIEDEIEKEITGE